MTEDQILEFVEAIISAQRGKLVALHKKEYPGEDQERLTVKEMQRDLIAGQWFTDSGMLKGKMKSSTN